MKDYYDILGVTEGSDEEQIRRQYRKLAMQYHPDRNPDDPNAEAKFKEVAEAYGVLTDPVKRSEYDRARANGGTWQDNAGQGGFTYSQEDILRDLFKDPRFQMMFQGLLREFQRSGFRSSSRFVRSSFFGGKGLFIGGLFMFGSLVGPALMKSAGKQISEKDSLLKRVGGKIGSLLDTAKTNNVEPNTAKPKAGASDDSEQSSPNDITYMMPLTTDELRQGKTVQVVTEGPDGQEMLKVKIPPHSRPGKKLRLRGKGRPGAGGRGNLYLQLEAGG